MQTAHTITLAAWLLIVLALLGSALRSLLRRWFAHHRSIGLATGTGAVAVTAALTLSYRLTSTIWPGLAVLIALTLAGLTTSVRRAWQSRAAHPLPAIPAILRTVGANAETWLLIGVLVVMLPVLSLGPTPFSAAGWDFHRYAGSTLVWLSQSGIGPDFATTHPDNYGLDQIDRAHFEKPYSTGLMTAITLASTLAPFKLQGALTTVLVVITVLCLYRVIIDTFLPSPLVAAACAVVPVLSIAPMARLYDAQIGHGTAVAFTATLLALASTTQRQSRPLVPGTVLGFVLAATIGANFSLVASALPALIAALIWVWHRQGRPARPTATAVAVCLAVAGLLSLAFIGWFSRSYALQHTGLASAHLALPPPSALIGIPFDAASTGPTQAQFIAGAVSLMEWAVVLLGVLIAAVVRWRTGRGSWPAIAFAAVTLGSLMMLSARFGPTAYGTHKWAVYALAAFGPLVLAAAAAAVPTRFHRWVPVAAAGCVVVATTSTIFYGLSLPTQGNVVTGDMLALETNPALASATHINVDFGDGRLTENSLGPLIISTRSITVVPGTIDYYPASAPEGDLFLTRADTAAARGWAIEQPLNSTYVLARRTPASADTPLMTTRTPEREAGS